MPSQSRDPDLEPELIPSARRAHPRQKRALVISGRLNSQTGGPLNTIRNIVTALSTSHRTELLALHDEPLDRWGIGNEQGRPHTTWYSLARAIFASMRDADVVVIVGVWHLAFALAALATLRYRRAQVVLVPTNSLTAWDWAKHRRVKNLIFPLLHLYAYRVEKVVVASTGEAIDIRPKNFKDVIVIPHAVREVQALSVTPNESPIILFVGRLHPQKNIELLLQAAAQVSDDYVLILCGAGDDEYVRSLKRLADRLGVNAKWLGWQSPEQVDQLYTDAAVVAVTSYSENFCHAAAEAASIGTPVIVVDRVASAKDLQECPAISLAKSTPESMSAALTKTLRNKTTQKSRSEAREWAQGHWSATAYATAWTHAVSQRSILVRKESDPTIVGAILTLNEERSVQSAIESLSWCDAVVVVDSGSTDTTTELAKQSGARVLTHIQRGRFLITDQRNWAVEQLAREFEWVVFLDADEVSTTEFANEVLTVIATTKADALYAVPAFMFHGRWLKHMSGFPNIHPRILRSSGGVKFTGGVWEDFDSKNTTTIHSPYLHFANIKGASDWLERHNKYASWEAERILASDSSLDQRRAFLRNIRYRLGPARRLLSMSYLLLFRRGLLDGRPALSYARRMATYEAMIDVHLEDLRRNRHNEPL